MFRSAKKVERLNVDSMLSDAISLLEVADDGKTILTEHGYILQVIKLDGVHELGLNPHSREGLISARENFFKSLTAELNYSFFYRRKKVTFDDREKLHSGNAIANRMTQKYESSLKGLYKTDMYLVLSKKIKPILSLSPSKYSEKQRHVLDMFSMDVGGVADSLKKYRPHVLTHEADGSGELLPFWYYMINGGNEGASPTQSSSLGRILSASEVVLQGRSLLRNTLYHMNQH